MIDESLWRATELPVYPPDGMPNQVDVAIIGGGITGLTAAYLLKKSGKRVAVFERERVGSGDSGNTSAHLTHVTDLRLRDMVKEFGKDAARLVWEGNARAIDTIETIAIDEKIDCEFTRVPGFLCSPFLDDKDEAESLGEDAVLAIELGFPARYVTNGPITGKPAVHFADQALFHPLKYLAGLARAVHGDGSFVFERAEASEVRQDPLAVVVNGELVACNEVMIATHVPIMGSAGMVSAMLLQTKLYPYSSYVLGAPMDASLAPGLYFDTANPYVYLRVHDIDGQRYAIFGGQDHKTGTVSNTEECFEGLVKQLARIVPSAKVERRWSGQVIETIDGLPYIGATADFQFAATGYAGNGLTFGTLAGMLMHDAVLEIPNPLHDVLDPHRKAKSLSSVGKLVKENAQYPFYMIRDRLRVRHDADGIEPGDGRVLLLHGKRVACHRTDDGTLIKVSAVCTHMGCLVRWNGAERTWDCPCHGSRFTPDGLVLGGPAETPLERVED